MIESPGQDITKSQIKKIFSANPWGSGYFIDGKYGEGKFIKWYYSGQLEIRAIYKSGKRNGIYEEYDKNGKMYKSRTYKNDKREGEATQWYDNGNILKITYFKDDKEHGECKVYHENGEIGGHGWHRNGHRSGEWAEFKEDGKCIIHNMYNDQLDADSNKPEVERLPLNFKYNGKLRHDKELEQPELIREHPKEDQS
jgi:antitoxin component YwqK of YwqJK toxin-antitoxin module